MPDVPTDAELWINGLYPVVYRFLRLTRTRCPQAFPCEQLGVSQHQAPELDIAAIDRPNAFAACHHEFFHFKKALSRTLRVDALAARLRIAELAEACGGRWLRMSMACTQNIGQRSLPLRAPHDAVDVVRTRPVFGDVLKPAQIVGIVETESGGFVSRKFDLLQLLDVG